MVSKVKTIKLEILVSSSVLPQKSKVLSGQTDRFDCIHTQRLVIDDLIKKRTRPIASVSVRLFGQKTNIFLQDSDFDKTSGFLGSTMDKLKQIAASGYGKMWCYLFMWILGVAFVMYFILRF